VPLRNQGPHGHMARPAWTLIVQWHLVPTAIRSGATPQL
jgi:hypothetical protein